MENKSQPRKIMDVIILMKIIFIYSDKKIKANPPLLYSILNPLTSSLSPSAKSKGDRLVSAKQEETQQKNKGIFIKINHVNIW